MSLQLSRIVLSFLENHQDQQFTAKQIASWIFAQFPEECAEKNARSQIARTDAELVQQIAAEIGSQFPRLAKRNTQFRRTQSRPKRYYFTRKSEEQEIVEAEQPGKPAPGAPKKLSEHDLYPLLCDYLCNQHALYPKRINEKRSSNRQGSNGNRWLYPDLVALENLSMDWHEEVNKCADMCGDTRVRLWSFEVKLKLNRSNIRENFFQAVSNSSWANAGYLVAAEIGGDDTLKELRMLFGLHGIGLIRLDTCDPADSEIMIPARERRTVDWNTCSRLADENKDFQQFMTLIREFHQTENLRQQDWDIWPEQ